MVRDLQLAVRMLFQSKGWTAIVLLSLALGIGVNTTLFSAINSLMLKTLVVKNPEELVRFRWAGENQMMNWSSNYGYSEPNAAGQRVQPNFSYRIFESLRESNQTLSGIFACAPSGRLNVVVQGNAELASAFLSTGNYFEVLGVPAMAGRLLLPSDDQPEAPLVAVISYGYWGRRFGFDPEVVGMEVRVNQTPVTIVGVTPPEFSGVRRLGDSAPDIHLPLQLDQQINGGERLAGNYWWLLIGGRLKPGGKLEQVQGNLAGVFQEAARAGWDSYYSELSPEQRQRQRNQNRTNVPFLEVASAARGFYDPSPTSARSINILGVVVALVLLIVCANVANLLLSRATSRRKEISIRLSLGATRTRLVRQLLTESFLLSGLGGGLALLVTYWGRRLLPFGDPPPLDWNVFAFAALISLLTGVVFGTIPALRATGLDLADSLKGGSRSVTRSRTLLGKSLLVIQVALSLVLLVGAGLFLKTLDNLRNVEVGFDTRGLLLVSVNPQVNGYDTERSQQLLMQMREHFEAIPGVESVGLSQTALLAGSTWTSSMHIQGAEQEESESAHMMTVSPEFFETLGIPLLTGRGLTRADNREAPKVALINEAAARAFFGEASPLGRRFGFSPETSGDYEVIGVVGNTKYASLREEAPPTVYEAYLQSQSALAMTFALRTRLEPRSIVPAVRDTVAQLDPNLPIGDISTQSEEIEERFSQERTFALAYSFFGMLALLLAAIGLFGLMSYSVAQRTNEIGIRMALGARRNGVIRMVLGESLVLVVLGSAIGLVVTLLAGRLVAGLLYDLEPTDPLTMAGAVFVMLAVSAFAGYLPARRASRVDPMVALHHE